MKYLVTGGAGFLGSHLCRRLLEDGHKVICLDDLSTGTLSNIEEFLNHKNFEFIKHDLVKPFFPAQLSGIFNLASPASPVSYQYNPIRTLKMGTLAIYNVLGIATRLKVPILQASTSEIYGNPTEHPQKETYWGNVNPIGPRACYNEGKRVSESLCMAYYQHNKTEIRIARIFNTYGPKMAPTDGRVISNFVTQALDDKDITIYGDGNQTRSFCYVDDLIQGLISLLNSDYHKPVNLGNPDEYKILDIAKKIKNITSSNSEFVFSPIPGDDPERRKPDISVAKEILGWEPKINIDIGLLSAIDWYKKNK